jgi:hypothetical protein
MSTPSPTPTPTPSPTPAPVVLTPPLNASGEYTVNAPFALVPNTIYVCKAIRSYADLIASGVNVYQVYYANNGLSQSQYTADLNAGANIITLMSDTSPTVYVPDTYIAAVPSIDNVPYSEVIMAVSLGPLPSSINLAFAQQQIADAASNTIGVEADVQIWLLPTTGIMSQAQSDAAETARQAAITNRTTDYAALLALQAQYAQLQSKYTILENMVIQAGLVSPTPAPAPGTGATTPSFTFEVDNLQVTFQNTSTDSNTITQWTWNFGDGAGGSALEDPVYTYQNAGTYHVVLTITDATGNYSTQAVPVTVTAPPAPTPSPTPTPTPTPSP